MRTWPRRLAVLFSALLLGISALCITSFAWEKEQQALNDLLSEGIRVTLTKFEKTEDGKTTEKRIPDTGFYLFREDGTQIGGEFITDVNGQITVMLSPGTYYFEEIRPAGGYTYDRDVKGDAVKRYPFVVKEDALLVEVTAYNIPISVEIKIPDVSKVVTGEGAPKETFSFILKGDAGTPMPEGVTGKTARASVTGPGQASFGNLKFTKPGEYVYTVYELDGGDYNWKYDTSRYTLVFQILQQDGVMTGSCTIKKGSKTVNQMVFTNRYEEIDIDEIITIQGTKTWEHGKNREEKRPSEIVVYLFANGSLTEQRKVTAEDSWAYSFAVRRYDSKGREITYHIDEEDIAGYSKKIDGYDLINTYEEKPIKPPKTGEDFDLAFWIAVGLFSLSGLILMVVLLVKKTPYQGRRVKKKGKRLPPKKGN